MRMFETVAAGLFTLLSTPALADLPVAQSSWGGCNYRLHLVEDSRIDPIKYTTTTFYRVIVDSEVVSSATCHLTPGSVELGTSDEVVPNIDIEATEEGLVVAYSSAGWTRFYGYRSHVEVKRLDPNSLATTRTSYLEGGHLPPGGGAGGPGETNLGEIVILPGAIMVFGSLGGNSISDLNASPYENTQGTGNAFTATYVDFFNSTTRPFFSIYQGY
ncbi:MAG: hypothetical protein ABW123_26255 [Cystobacter sp.]